MPNLKLYHNDMSSCSQKVRLVLSEKNLSWYSHHMNLREGETRSKEYISKFNENGVVGNQCNVYQITWQSRTCYVAGDFGWACFWPIQDIFVVAEPLCDVESSY